MADNDNEIVPSIARGGNFPRATGDAGPESIARGGNFPRATGDDVEGHSRGDESDAGPESIARGGNFPRATEGEDAPGPDGLK